MIYFFDTTALIHLFEGKESYENYYDSEIIISWLNLVEFDYYCIKTNRKDRKTLFKYLKDFCIAIDDETVHLSNEFRYFHKQRDISYVDAIGYCLAKKNKLKFLTDDTAFKDLQNVEFVQ